MTFETLYASIRDYIKSTYDLTGSSVTEDQLYQYVKGAIVSITGNNPVPVNLTPIVENYIAEAVNRALAVTHTTSIDTTAMFSKLSGLIITSMDPIDLPATVINQNYYPGSGFDFNALLEALYLYLQNGMDGFNILGQWVEFAYIGVPKGASPPSTPTGGSFDGNVFTYPLGWLDDSPVGNDIDIYRSQSTWGKDSKGTWSMVRKWTIPVRITGVDGNAGTDGQDGIGSDGAYYEFIYKASSAVPSRPSGGHYDGNSFNATGALAAGWNSISGWNDNPPTSSLPIYMSKGRFVQTGSLWEQDGMWSFPVRTTGLAGSDGTPGLDGQIGNTVSVGYVYWQSTGSSSKPSAPTSGYWDTLTNSVGGLSSGWGVNPPSMSATTQTQTIWYCYYSYTLAAGQTRATLTFGPVTKGTHFEGLVSFTSLNSALSQDPNYSGPIITTIDGGLIKTGKIEAARIDVDKLYVGYGNITNAPTHTSGSLANRPKTAVEGSTYTDTGVTPNVVYIYGPSGWSTANQGQFKSIVFKRSSTVPNPPTNGSYASPVPSGWSDGIPAENGSPCYFSARTFTVNGGPPQDASWSTPVMVSNTADTKYVFSSSTAQPYISGTGPNTPSGWSTTASVDTVWSAVSTMSNGTWTSWSVYKIKGEAGLPGKRGAATGTGTTASDSAFTKSTGLVPQSGDSMLVSGSSGSGFYVRGSSTDSWTYNTEFKVSGNAIIGGSLGIGQFLMSTNFNGTFSNGVIAAKGTTGWAIDAAGNAAFNKIDVRVPISNVTGQITKGNMQNVSGSLPYGRNGSAAWIIPDKLTVSPPVNGKNYSILVYAAINGTWGSKDKDMSVVLQLSGQNIASSAGAGAWGINVTAMGLFSGRFGNAELTLHLTGHNIDGTFNGQFGYIVFPE